ncbi:MAG: DNA-binding response regulator [Phycisphaeraceae bacterium]|nr:DNA-binding response regulator [Phycisphaeraceae bacterium]
MTEKIDVVLADDHEIILDALKHRLAAEPDIDVVATAHTADEAIDVCLEHRPDVVVMDINMPGMICFDAAKRIMSASTQTRVVFLSGFIQDGYIDRALKVKAWGYLAKTSPTPQLVDAIRQVARGRVYFSSEVQSRMVVDPGETTLEGEKNTLLSTLTNRELEVLLYVARGLSKKEIASTMHVSVKTVEGHTEKLMTKVDIHDRVELALFAVRENLVHL